MSACPLCQRAAVIASIAFGCCASVVWAWQPATDVELSNTTETPTSPSQVDVAPTANDRDIATRLQRILQAANWFDEPRVRVEEGVVFITGIAESEQVKEWASNVARRTQDVVAVVNRMDVAQPSVWDLSAAAPGLRALWHDTIALLPFLLVGAVIFLITGLVALLSVGAIRRLSEPYISTALLREVVARTAGFVVLLLGVYIVLRVSGLTRLALTVVGGTGILGLVIGIAFRDITENFLASIFLSMQRPFLVGDLVEIVNVLGYVQRLTVRTTVLMTLNGNRVEIPNSTVYKSTIRNFSTNKNRREDFTVGVAYDVPIPRAQEVALRVLHEHPAVLQHPEPWALVDSLGSASVVLRVYFWLDGSEHSWLKVRSSVIRLVKRALQDAGITIPDEAREVVFPKGVPVQMFGESQKNGEAQGNMATETVRQPAPEEPLATSAEGSLRSEAGEIEGQAQQSRKIEGDNLLARSPNERKH